MKKVIKKKSRLTKAFYGEFAGTLRKIAKYERGEKVSGYTAITRPVPASSQEVKDARKLMQRSQAAFADFLGVSTKLIQAWEQGWRTPEALPTKVIRAIKRDPKVLEILAQV